MNGADFVEKVRDKLSALNDLPITDRALTMYLGISVQGLANLKAREDVTAAQMAGLLFKTEQASRARAHSDTIRPIVEFFEIARSRVALGSSNKVFNVKNAEGVSHPYLSGLRSEL